VDHRANPVTTPATFKRRGVALERPARRGWFHPFAWFFLLLAVLELTWLAWFLVVPLPNFPKESGTMRRGFLLLKAFPEVVPGTTFRESLIGQAARELSHVENLPERLPIVGAAALIVLAALGLGELVLAGLRLRDGMRPGERLAVGFGIGTTALGVLALLGGRAGLLDPWIFRIGLGVIAMAGLGTSKLWRVRWTGAGLGIDSLLPILIIAPFLIIMLLGAMLPSIDFDVLEYHLQGPKEYFQAGRIAFLPHNVYTSMPFGVEMLHLMGMEVLGDWWWGGLVGQLLVALYAPAAAVLIAAATGRAGTRRAAWLAAVIYLSTPWIYRMGVIADVEGPLCFYHAALIWGVIRGWTENQHERGRLWLLLGLLAGGAMACKYPALISAVIPLGLLAVADCWRARSTAPVLACLLGWSMVMAPWLARNVVDTGNPVYPLGYHVFGGRLWNEAREAQWQGAHGPKEATLNALGDSLADVAGRSDWQSPLYLAFAPLAFIRPGSRRLVLALGGFAAYLFFAWWLLTHRIDRFWLPLLPCLAILAGLGADWSERWSWRILRGTILAIALVGNFIDCTTALTGLNEWTGNLAFLRRDVPRRLNPPLAAIDRVLPPDARILLVGQAAVFHVGHEILYNTVFNPETIELLAAGKNPQEFHRILKDRGITHVYVDWKEINRHRAPAGYGFTDFVTPERFAAWIQAGVLDRPVPIGLEDHPGRIALEQDLYPVR
jgi:dolichyl-phosphate-mannose-protein mannosyltransferase